MVVVDPTEVASAHILLGNHFECEIQMEQWIQAIISNDYRGLLRWYRMAVVGACSGG